MISSQTRVQYEKITNKLEDITYAESL